MSKYCLILTTTDDQKIAEEVAKILVERNLAGCVQIDQVKSYCRWQEKFMIGDEYRLMIKANDVNYTAIENEILKNHNYQLPQIIKLDITDGLKNYLKWLG